MGRRVIGILLIVAVVCAGAFWSWKHKQVTADTHVLALYGNVDIRRVQLGFRVPGRLSEMRFKEGDRVAQGQVLAVLDKTPLDQELTRVSAQRDQAAVQLARLEKGLRVQEIDQARAQVREREAAYRGIDLEYERRQALVATGAVTEQSFDDITARRDQAQAQLDGARAALSLAEEGSRREDVLAAQASLAEAQAAAALAQTRVSDTELTAPNAGILLTRVEEPGAVVGAGQTVAVLSLTDPVWIRTYLAEPDLGRVWPGMKAEVVTDTRPDQPYHGHVGHISPEAEFTPKQVETPQLRTDLVFRVRVIVDNPDEGLRQGMPVTVILDTTQTPPDQLPGSQS